MLRSDFATLEHKLSEMNNDMMKELLEDFANLEKDFKKQAHVDSNDMAHLKQ